MVWATWAIANAGDVTAPECILLRKKIREYGQNNRLRREQQGRPLKDRRNKQDIEAELRNQHTSRIGSCL